MENKTVLIADDDPDDLELFQTLWVQEKPASHLLLANNGAELLHAMNGIDAPVLVVLDLNMPVMDGLTCLKHIRGNEKWNDVKVVMLSTSSAPLDVKQCMGEGADRYIIKPNTIDEWETMI